jgi:NADPH:quinone reductase
MKAVQISRFGGPEVLKAVEFPTPVPEDGQLLVRVRAIGVNLADTLTRMNRYAVTPPLPAILGTEAAGVVEAIGSGARGFAVGQRVAVPLFAANSLGGYAEFAAIDAALAVPLPDAISFEQAAALQIQGLTALYLTRQASPNGKTVLINAAAGGVGSILVQLAKRAGARKVIAGASAQDKLEFTRSLGADAAVNYTSPAGSMICGVSPTETDPTSSMSRSAATSLPQASPRLRRSGRSLFTARSISRAFNWECPSF